MKEELVEQRGRRAFCAQCTRGVALLLAGSTLGMLEGCAKSPTAPEAAALPVVNGTPIAGGVTVTVDAASPLNAVGSAALVQSSVGDFLVAHTGTDTYVALTATCTHQACVVSGFGNNEYVCPCHGSTFDLNGKVVVGPALAPLQQFGTRFSNAVLTISA